MPVRFVNLLTDCWSELFQLSARRVTLLGHILILHHGTTSTGLHAKCTELEGENRQFGLHKPDESDIVDQYFR